MESSDWGQGVFGSPSVTTAPCLLGWVLGEGTQGQPASCSLLCKKPSSTEPAGASGSTQHTRAGFTPRLGGSQEPRGLCTSPSPLPRSDLCLQCQRGTGVTHGFTPSLIPGTKALVGCRFYHQPDLTDGETEAQRREVTCPKPHCSQPYWGAQEYSPPGN